MELELAEKKFDYSEISNARRTAIGTKKGYYGIAIDFYGNYICTNSRDRIDCFDFRGKFIRSIGSFGSGDENFNKPYGIAINSQGFIYVCDSDNYRIQMLDRNYKFIHRFGGLLRFQFPCDIAIDDVDNVYIVDALHDRVFVYSPTGEFIKSFGKLGNNPGEFQWPTGIRINSRGNIIVGDSLNSRVQVFDSDFQFLFTFGSYGNKEGQFIGYGIKIEIDNDDRIIVTDCCGHRILFFEPDGTFISSLGNRKLFNYPKHTIVNYRRKRLLVCDGKNKKVHVVNLSDIK